MKNSAIMIITTLALVNGLWGCTSTQNTHQTITSMELVGRLPDTGITRDEDSQLTPSHPTHVTAQAITDTIVLTWLGTGDDRIEYYHIFRRLANDGNWQFITRVKSTGDNRGWYEFKDTTIEMGIAYIYGVTAVDIYGNESAISESSVVIFDKH